MADVSDVEQELVNLAATALYPTPPGTGTTPSPVTSAVTAVTRGDPPPNRLDATLKANGVWVTVLTRPYTSHQVPGALRSYEVSRAPITAVVTLSGNTLTIGGTYSAGQPIVVKTQDGIFGYQPRVGGNGFVMFAYPVGGPGVITNDPNSVFTPDSFSNVTTALAGLIPNCTQPNNHTIVLPGAPASLRVTLGTTGVVANVMRREVQDFLVRSYAPTQALRDATMRAVDNAFVASPRIAFSDGTYGLLRYGGVSYDNLTQRDGLFERTNSYQVEYEVVRLTTVPTIAGFILPTPTVLPDLP